MQKDPQQRYRSVESLAADLQRYLQRRPVLVRPDSFSYKAARFTQRNRAPIALAGALAAPLLGFGGLAAYEAHLACKKAGKPSLRTAILSMT